ncbi:hypothetical protein FS837_004832, partial [Tulasnella sp. UAMH 9824]
MSASRRIRSAADAHRKRARELDADPEHALVYTNGSLRKVQGVAKAAAGVTIYCHGDVVKERA